VPASWSWSTASIGVMSQRGGRAVLLLFLYRESGSEEFDPESLTVGPARVNSVGQPAFPQRVYAAA
jgi:hypothetical protein